MPLVLVLNLTTCISSKFGHWVTPLAIVWNLADSWLHFHQLEICPPGNTKSIINRIGLCLVMKTMILTMVYLSWWAGSVQWRLQSLYDEVKIRRHVDKIYYLCLLKLFYFFSRKVYFSQIWWAIFLETIFLHLINMHMEKRSKFQTFSAHSISTTIWPPGGTTCISWKFSHQMTPLAIFGKLANRWLHFNKLKIWPSCGATFIFQSIAKVTSHHLH